MSPPRIKQQPVARSAKPKLPIRHAHGCNVCGRRFGDTCARPLEARTCPTCTQGNLPTREDLDRDPKSCCEIHSRLITDVDELSKYGLGGHTPWFRCAGANGCSRTHPFKPTSITQE